MTHIDVIGVALLVFLIGCAAIDKLSEPTPSLVSPCPDAVYPAGEWCY